MKNFILIISTFTFLLFACSKETSKKIEILKNISENISDASILSQKDIEKKLTNYSITLKVTEDNKVTKWTEIKCEKGFFINTDDSTIIYSKYSDKKYYVLSNKEKTGVCMPLNSDELINPSSMGFIGISSFIFFFETFRYLGAKKTSSDKILDRETDIYTFDIEDKYFKIWLDKEYGICTKYELNENGKKSKMEVVNLKFGNASIDNVIDLSKFTIQEIAKN